MALLPTLAGYRREWLRADVLAGLAAGAVVIPQAMAYATVARMPAQVGLYTCMVPMLVYAFLGGSRTLSTSTTSTIVTLTASALIAVGVTAGDTRALATLTIEVGLILLAARLLGLGTLVENVSEAALLGVKAAVGLTVGVTQIPRLLGFDVPATDGRFLTELPAVLRALPTTQPTTALLSAGLLALLVGLGLAAPRLPAPLIAVAVVIPATALFNLSTRGVALVPPVPKGLAPLTLPDLGQAAKLLPGALTIALLAAVESLAAARAAPTRKGEPPPDDQREMLATGAASALGGFFSALPSAGGFSQTAVNARAGARTQVSQLTTVVLAVAVALWLAPVLRLLPDAALAALVLVAVGGLVNPAAFIRLARVSPRDLFVAAATTLVGLAAGLLAAVVAGVVATLVLVLRELNEPQLFELHPEHPDIPPQAPQPLVVRLETYLYTANMISTQNTVLELVGARKPTPDVIMLEMRAQTEIGTTVLDRLHDLGDRLSTLGSQLWIVGLPPRATATAIHNDWWQDWQRAGRIHATLDDALTAYASRPRSA